MGDEPWKISPARLRLAACLAMVLVTVVVWLMSSWGLPGEKMAAVAAMHGGALAIGFPFLWRGVPSIADPSRTFENADYETSRVSIGGHSHVASRYRGTQTMQFSRRGAIGFTSVGLVLYAGLLIGGVFLARALG
jgi:hypothetical protein